MKNDYNVQKMLSNSFHSQDSNAFNLLSVDKWKRNDDEKKYGVVKNRWGNYLIGRYIIDRKQLDFDGIICRKYGIFSHSYIQGFEQMLKTDYPIEISKEIYDTVFSIMYICIAEIIEILNDQPPKQRQQILNSKFFIKCDTEIDLCNVSLVSDTYTYYDGIHLSCKDYPSLFFEKSICGVEEKEKKYGCSFLESKVYEIILQKIKDTQMIVELIIKKAYNNQYSIAYAPID